MGSGLMGPASQGSGTTIDPRTEDYYLSSALQYARALLTRAQGLQPFSPQAYSAAVQQPQQGAQQ